MREAIEIWENKLTALLRLSQAAELPRRPSTGGEAGLELLKPAAENMLQKWPVSKRGQ